MSDIPSLEEVLGNNTGNAFSRQQFLAYLYRIHCVENLEFVLDINDYMRGVGSDSKSPTNNEYVIETEPWTLIYSKYFSPDSTSEINLPYTLTKQLSPEECPQLELLIRAKKFIYDDILVNLYHEFVRYVKKEESTVLLPELCCLDSEEETSVSRGNSIGSIMDSFKSNVDYGKFKMKFRRRFSNTLA